MDQTRLGGLALAAGSGILYGSINVLAKPLDVHPLAKTAIAYLTSALVLSWALRGLRVARADWPKVLAMGLLGGGLAPVLLFYGLEETAAADAGLLLTLELVATATLAHLFLQERFPGREAVGLVALLAAAACVAVGSGTGSGGTGSTVRGMLLVLGSAVTWGIDNAVSTRLVGSYRPPGLIAVKGLLGGSAALVAVLVVGVPVPDALPALGMSGLGVLSVAVSSLLFYTALGRIGAARTSAMNIATTALIGAAGGAALLSERLGPLHGVAILLVLAGAWMLARPGGVAASPSAA